MWDTILMSVGVPSCPILAEWCPNLCPIWCSICAKWCPIVAEWCPFVPHHGKIVSHRGKMVSHLDRMVSHPSPTASRVRPVLTCPVSPSACEIVQCLGLFRYPFYRGKIRGRSHVEWHHHVFANTCIAHLIPIGFLAAANVENATFGNPLPASCHRFNVILKAFMVGPDRPGCHRPR